MSDRSALQALAMLYPDWRFRIVWLTVPSGPDRRILRATHDRYTVSAYDVPGLSLALAQTAGER